MIHKYIPIESLPLKTKPSGDTPAAIKSWTEQEVAAFEKEWIDLAAGPEIPEVTPETQIIINHLEKHGRALGEAVLQKISEQLGSNEGGWFQHQITREKYYIKLYQDPNRARVEFVANEIYVRLGIPAARSQLFEMNGRLAVASKEIPGAQSTTREQQHASSDVTSGFMADAYLGNWDVVGLVYDNIVRGSDGRMHRIDNGGSLIFRAQGAKKEYSPDNIPELQTMQNPEYTAGQVFQGLTEDRIREQAEHLVRNLTEADIDEIITRSGLQGEDAQTIRAGLVGRRNFLIKRFGIKEVKTLDTNVWQRLWESLEASRENAEAIGIRPEGGVPADTDQIEGQQIFITEMPDQKGYMLVFKLTAEKYIELIERIKHQGAKQRSLFSRLIKRKPEVEWHALDYITYSDQEHGGEYEITSAWSTEYAGIKIKVAQNYGGVNAALGLVVIELPKKGTQENSEFMRKKLETAITATLGITEILKHPDEKSERAFMRARYLWHHKLNPASVTEVQWREIERKLKREEVFPGYFTIVEPGKHKEYQAIAEYAPFMKLQSVGHVLKILRSGGVLATHCRYRRGMHISGMSSHGDFESGGADSVFIRTLTEDGAQRMDGRYSPTQSVHIVFSPDIFDRTDWYAYPTDTYGRTALPIFGTRQSPEDLFEGQKSSYSQTNEQMFRVGIPIEKMKAIVCESEYERSSIISQLHSAGVLEINGVPIDKFIRLARTYPDLIDIASDRTPRSEAPMH